MGSRRTHEDRLDRLREIGVDRGGAGPAALTDRSRSRRPHPGRDGAVDRGRDRQPALGWHRRRADRARLEDPSRRARRSIAVRRRDRSSAGCCWPPAPARRLGSPKAQVAIDGVRLLDRAVDVLRAAGCTDLVAVLRAPRGRCPVSTTRGQSTIPTAGWARRCGWVWRPARGEVAVVMLVDTPGIGADAVRAVLAAVAGGRAGRDRRLRRASGAAGRVRPRAVGRGRRAGRRRPGGPGFLRAHPELVTAVPCAGDPADIDTPADLARWRAGR